MIGLSQRHIFGHLIRWEAMIAQGWGISRIAYYLNKETAAGPRHLWAVSIKHIVKANYPQTFGFVQLIKKMAPPFLHQPHDWTK